jgi:tRNA(Arg) A34 adenosine deaminase TadA
MIQAKKRKMIRLRSDHHDFMLLAIKKAREGVRKDQSPFGACIVKDGKVVSLAHNMVWKTRDITAHAEVTAIREACKKLKTIDLSGCTIYSTCEPCPMCFCACHWAKISQIFYGARITDAKKFGFHELVIVDKIMKRLGKCSVKIRQDFLREENLELFRFWSERNGKKTY